MSVYAVFLCGDCGEEIRNPPSIPSTCRCGSKDLKLVKEKSIVPEEMVEKAKPQVVEKRVEALEVKDEFRKADSRGRVRIGTSYADKNVRLAVLEVKEEVEE